jgi:hypothetical protein
MGFLPVGRQDRGFVRKPDAGRPGPAIRVIGRTVNTPPSRDCQWLLEIPGAAGFVREIFGNPFRPVTFSPKWQTGTALSLARWIYESRNFSPVPILADALQDAGCENEEILNHSRRTGLHIWGVLGC